MSTPNLDDLIDIVDLFPTFCELAGASLPSTHLDGFSFAKRIAGDGKTKRQWVTAGIRGEMSVFDGQWRLNGKSGKLIDCRNLPAEKPAVKGDPDAEAARERLAKVLEDVR